MKLSNAQTELLLLETYETNKQLSILKQSPKMCETFGKILLVSIQMSIAQKQNKQPYWVPSSAENPDPNHMPFYGKWLDEIPNGERPGDRIGCQCSIGYKYRNPNYKPRIPKKG